jgi:hypothetical protein
MGAKRLALQTTRLETQNQAHWRHEYAGAQKLLTRLNFFRPGDERHRFFAPE